MQTVTKTQIKFIETCSSIFNNRFEYRGDFLTKTHVTLFDTVHNITIIQDKSSHYKGRLPREIKLLDDDILQISELKELSSDFIRPTKILGILLINKKQFVRYIDLKTNLELTQRIESFKKEVISKDLLNTLEYTLENLDTNIKDKYNYISYSNKYISFTLKNETFVIKQRLDSHKIGEITREESSYLTGKRFLEKAKKLHFDKYDYSLVNFIRSNRKVKILCPTHGSFDQTPNSHSSGKGCRFCFYDSNVSKAEKKLFDFIRDLGFKPYGSYRPKWLKRKELDIYIPELNLAIEYNGSIYHHSSKDITNFLNSTYINPNYHLDKYLLCQTKSINLVHIFEFEEIDIWYDKLLSYSLNPEMFDITFENKERTFLVNKKNLTFYGQSFIETKY